jgi:hypothetical protein
MTLEIPDELMRKPQDEAAARGAVSRRTDSEGFLITAYPTDAIKEGEQIWPI